MTVGEFAEGSGGSPTQCGQILVFCNAKVDETASRRTEHGHQFWACRKDRLASEMAPREGRRRFWKCQLRAIRLCGEIPIGLLSFVYRRIAAWNVA